MTASSRYTRAISSEVGDIERRLRNLQNGIEKLGTRASSNARDTADGLGEAVASAFVRALAPSAINLPPSATMQPGTGLQP
jgi:hypothetical protein